MILVDYSSSLHRKLYTSIKQIVPKKDIDGKFITSEFIQRTKELILKDIEEIRKMHGAKFGGLVLCFDNYKVKNWRKEIYPLYKGNRSTAREESEINYQEVFKELESLHVLFKNFTDIPCIEVDSAEADDCIMILAKHIALVYNEPVLVFSADKDMIQSQRHSPLIEQHSPMTHKKLVAECKAGSMAEWVFEHICLGDDADNIPKIAVGLEFSENFKNWLTGLGVTHLTPSELYERLGMEKFYQLCDHYKIEKKNRKGEDNGIKDIFIDVRFGPSNLWKKVKDFGGIEEFLDSDPLLRQYYERNRQLILDENIPEHIVNECIKQYDEFESKFQPQKINEWFFNNNISPLVYNINLMFNSNSKKKRELTIEDFGW